MIDFTQAIASCETVDEITCNGCPVYFSLELVTNLDGNGWKGIRGIGSYRTLKELNKAINDNKHLAVNGWMLHVDFQDDFDIEKEMFNE